MGLTSRPEGPGLRMIPAQRRRRRISVALAVGGGLLGVVSSDRKGTHAVVGAYRATRVGRCSLVARAGLIVAVTLVCGLGGVSTSVAAAADPSYAWATKGGGPGGDEAHGVSALADGSSIITGYFSGTATFGATTLTSSAGSTDTFTAKVNADGTYAWATRGGGPGADHASDVSALADGSSIITGSFSGTATFGATTLTSSGGSDDTFTAKVNANGTYAWATQGGGPGTDSAYGVSVRANGSSIITGYFSGTIAIFGSTTLTNANTDGSFDTFTAKVNADGTYAWATRGGGLGGDVAYGVSALADGSSIITGYFSGTTATFGSTTLTSAGGYDTFTAKVNADGTYAWATQGGGRVLTPHMAFRHLRMVRASSPDPSVVLRPSEARPSQTLGQLTRSRRRSTLMAPTSGPLRVGGPGADEAFGVSALADGSSIITGYFGGTATFGTTNLISAGSDDTFTAKVNADGTYAWATRGGGASYDVAYGVSALADGSSIITGSFYSTTATFGSTTLTNTNTDGSSDTFTARIVADAPVNIFTMKKLLKISARSITTQLNLPGPGKVVQLGTTRLSTPRATELAKKVRTMIVCRVRKTVAKAGKVTIICRLTAEARAARKKHALKVRLVTTFTPTGGTARSVSRTLVLKKTR